MHSRSTYVGVPRKVENASGWVYFVGVGVGLVMPMFGTSVWAAALELGLMLGAKRLVTRWAMRYGTNVKTWRKPCPHCDGCGHTPTVRHASCLPCEGTGHLEAGKRQWRNT